MVRDFGKVAVLMGGHSSEREVSLLSGRAVLDALCGEGVNAIAFDPAAQPLLSLPDQGFDAVFNILHGPGGEDGTVQGFLELTGIPYTGSGVLASALTMDKAHTKRVLQAANLPTPAWRYLTPADDAQSAAESLGLPLVVKPVSQGSSVGMSMVREVGQLASALKLAFAVEPQLLIERLVEGPEHTVTVLGEKALPSILIETPRTFYDYEAKYETDSTRYICPGSSGAHEQRLQSLALETFRLLGCRGWSRVDFLTDAESGEPSIIEINTVPGMTSHSLVPISAAKAGLSFGELCVEILELALADCETTAKEVRSYGA